jgi:hypothetical protein
VKVESAKLCALHEAELLEPLPKGWTIAAVDAVPLYVNFKANKAQWRHPGTESAREAVALKVKAMPAPSKKALPRALFAPQPADMPEGWCVG